MINFATAFIQTGNILSIGDFYQGGYIAYLSGSAPNQHGIIMAPTNTPSGSFKNGSGTGVVPYWGSTLALVSGSFSTAIGGGKPNTLLMLSSSLTSGSYVSGSSNRAANEAQLFSFNGYNDWVIPSIQELSTIWNNLAVNSIGAPYSKWPTAFGGTGQDRSYMTSNQFNASRIYSVQLQEGGLTPGGQVSDVQDKNVQLNLRLIRYF